MDCYLGVFGHTTIDIILQVPELPKPNSSIGVDSRVERYGGTGANMAKAAADLGVKTSLASFVGDDFSDEYLAHLKESSVLLDELEMMEGYKTPMCWLISGADEEQMAVIDQGPVEDSDDFPLQDGTIQGSEVLHIGTGRPGYYRRVIERASELDKTIGFDPAQELRYVYEPSLFKEMLERCDLFFCNRAERDVALDYLSLDAVEGMMDYVDAVIVTHGQEGSELYTDEMRVHIDAYQPEKTVDPTGAGDSYRAGFYAAMERGMDLDECCRFGSARASFALEFPGSQEGRVTFDQVERRLEVGETIKTD